MRYVCLLMFTTLLIGCSSKPVTDPTPSVSAPADSAPAEAVIADSGEESASDSDEIVIDVRSKEEWDGGHVEKAVNIPHTEIAERIGEVTEDKNAKIVVYCAVGGRAEKAKTKLEELGFTNVENAGGYDDVKQRYE